MKHTLLIGESNALFIENNKLFKKKIIKFEDLQNLGISDVRIISNRSDFEFRIGCLPKVYPWQSNIVKKSYIMGNTTPDRYFNMSVHKDTLTCGKYKTQDVLLAPDDITKNIISLYQKNVSGIEHLALVIPYIANTPNYWIFVGENVLGSYSIYCGMGEFLLFVRTIEGGLIEEISKTLIFFERFGYKSDSQIEKISVLKSPIDGFKNLYSGFSDEYLIARTFEQTTPLLPAVGPDNWARRCKLEVTLKYLAISLLICIFAMVIVNITEINTYKNTEARMNILRPQIHIVSNTINDLLSDINSDLVSERREFDELDRIFNAINSRTRQLLSNNPKKNCRLKDEDSYSERIILSDDYPLQPMTVIQHLFPNGMNITGYSYEASNNNGRSFGVIKIYTNSDQEITRKFIENVKMYLKNINKISIEQLKNSVNVITIVISNNSSAKQN